MRIFMTGATGFIGGRLARALAERGDEVRALVRTPAKAAALETLGVELVAGDLGDRDAIVRAVEGCDVVIHGAAIYEIGIPASRRETMRATNVGGTETVLGAALEAGTPKVVYVSSVVALGDTRGRAVGESYEPSNRPRSTYEETKRDAHQVALRLISDGLPCTILQPGGVYGPDDHSELGDQIIRAARGRLLVKAIAESRYTMVHVDDVVAGVLLALERGKPGESYILGGEEVTLGRMVDLAAALAGRHPPRITVPTRLLRLGVPFGALIGRVMKTPPNLAETIRATADATYLGDDSKARSELGYAPRGIEQGMRDTLAAEGLLKA